MLPEERKLLLHATVVNTIYVPRVRAGEGRARGSGGSRGRRGAQGEGHGRKKARLTLDARDVLEKYKDFEWMRDVRVEKVAICRMGAKKREDGEEEYEVEAEIDIPMSFV